jgi:hypothetical protein
VIRLVIFFSDNGTTLMLGSMWRDSSTSVEYGRSKKREEENKAACGEDEEKYMVEILASGSWMSLTLSSVEYINAGRPMRGASFATYAKISPMVVALIFLSSNQPFKMAGFEWFNRTCFTKPVSTIFAADIPVIPESRYEETNLDAFSAQRTILI